MVLICDSGSTKASWALIEKNAVQEFSSEGINPLLLSAEQIGEIFYQQVLPHLTQAAKISKVAFFGSGCNSIGISILNPALNSFFDCPIEIGSDLKGSALATLGARTGIVGILGTGSNSGFFSDGKLIIKVPSLGFILGDEGSGTHIGKQLISDYFKGNMPPKFVELLDNRFKITEEDAIRQVYHEGNGNRYLASFVPFIHENINTDYCNQLVKKSFHAFFQKNILNYNDYLKYELCITGSVASVFRPLLKEVAGNFGYQNIQVMQYPITGLIDYYRSAHEI